MARAKENFDLFFTFVKLGSVMFGGGYAMIPILERDLVEKKKWINSDELLEIMSVSQMTPGTIAINLATFIGSKRNGIWGGILASLGIIVPSLICVTTLFFLMDSQMSNEYLVKVFTGIRACLAAMILHSVYKLFRAGIKSHIPFLIFLGAIIALLAGLHPIYTILIGGFAGFIWKWMIPHYSNK
ncbi:chromate transporter [Carboxylicivirga linearis]|uniref:Chromate transporter n=1 Tax=Carboxylicivirga linearis TaxID=1628157 RepID=A0ABS5JSP9_9BACT|nr:chromate transporter [Carboxylicivirga linearis]MBS2097857.1 chromate transporter [Carboxylicivirga linearis]